LDLFVVMFWISYAYAQMFYMSWSRRLAFCLIIFL